MRKIETKKLAAAVTALALCAGVLTGCGGAASGVVSWVNDRNCAPKPFGRFSA